MEQPITLLNAQALVDAAGDGTCAMNFLTRGRCNDLLPVLAHQHGLRCQLAIRERHADHIAGLRRRVVAKQQVRRGQMKKVQRVRLENLSVVHQTTNSLGGRRQTRAGPRTHHDIHGLGRCQMMADRANAAQPLHQHRCFPIRTPLHETLESPELHNVQTALRYIALVVELDRDLAVSFHARDRINNNFAGHELSQSNLKVRYSKANSLPVTSASSASQIKSAFGGQPGRK